MDEENKIYNQGDLANEDMLERKKKEAESTYNQAAGVKDDNEDMPAAQTDAADYDFSEFDVDYDQRQATFNSKAAAIKKEAERQADAERKKYEAQQREYEKQIRQATQQGIDRMRAENVERKVIGLTADQAKQQHVPAVQDPNANLADLEELKKLNPNVDGVSSGYTDSEGNNFVPKEAPKPKYDDGSAPGARLVGVGNYEFQFRKKLGYNSIVSRFGKEQIIEPTSSEKASIESDKSMNSLISRFKETERKLAGAKAKSPERQRYIGYLIALDEQMRALELGFNSYAHMKSEPGLYEFAVNAPSRRANSADFRTLEQIIDNGGDLEVWNPVNPSDFPENVQRHMEEDKAAGKELPMNFYLNMAIRNKDYVKKIGDWALLYAREKRSVNWDDAINYALQTFDRQGEQLKENVAKEFADQWWSPVAGVLDSSIAKAEMLLFRLAGYDKEMDDIQETLDRSMKYGGRGKNAVRGLFQFAPDIALMAVTDGTSAGFTKGVSSLITLSPRAAVAVKGGLGFMQYEAASTILDSWGRGNPADTGQVIGNASKGFLLGAGGAMLEYGIKARLAPKVKGRIGGYAVRGVSGAGKVGTFASAEVAMELLQGKDLKDIDYKTILLNNGALIFTMDIAHNLGKLNKAFGLKRDVSRDVIQKCRNMGYNTLADELVKHNNLSFAGSEPTGFSEAARGELKALTEAMRPGGDMTWEEYTEVLRPTGQAMTEPGTFGVDIISDKRGVRLVTLDSQGIPIREIPQKSMSEAKKNQAKMQKKIDFDMERANEEVFDQQRDTQILAMTARKVADTINAESGKKAFNDDGTPNPEYDGYTANQVLEAFKAIQDKHPSERTESEEYILQRFLETMETVRGEAMGRDAVKTKICEYFGVSEEAFDKMWKTSPENRSGKEAQACAAYNAALMRGYEVTAGEPVAEAYLQNGDKVSLLNRVQLGEDGTASNPDQSVFYRDSNGNTHWTTAKSLNAVKEIEGGGEAADKVSEQNLQTKFEQVKADNAERLQEFDDERLEWEAQTLARSIELGQDKDGTDAIALRLVKEEQVRRAQERARADYEGMTQAQKAAGFVESRFSGKSEEEKAALTQYYTEHPVEYEEALSYPTVHAREIAELLKSLGVRNSTDWRRMYDKFNTDDAAFSEAYRKKFKEDPTRAPRGYEKAVEKEPAEVRAAEDEGTVLTVDTEGNVVEKGDEEGTVLKVDDEGNLIDNEPAAPEVPKKGEPKDEGTDDNSPEKTEPEPEGEGTSLTPEQVAAEVDFLNAQKADIQEEIKQREETLKGESVTEEGRAILEDQIKDREAQIAQIDQRLEELANIGKPKTEPTPKKDGQEERAKEYYIIKDEEQLGPFTIEQLSSMGVMPDTPVWTEGMPDWDTADKVAELQSLLRKSKEADNQGKRVDKLLDAMGVQGKERDELREEFMNDEESLAMQEEQFGLSKPKGTGEQGGNGEPGPVEEGSMPMKEVNGKQRPDYGKATAEQTHKYLSEKYSDKEREDFITNQRADKDKILREKEEALAAAKKAEEEGPKTRLSEETEDQYDAEKAQLAEATRKAQEEYDAAKADLEKWDKVKGLNEEGDKAKAEEPKKEEPKKEEPKKEEPAKSAPEPEQREHGIKKDELEEWKKFAEKSDNADLVARVEEAARKMGVTIKLYDGKDPSENGYTEDGVIYVNRKAGDKEKFSFVFGHEFAHNMQDAAEGKNSNTYKAFKKAAIDKKRAELGDEGYEALVSEKMEDYKDKISEEVFKEAIKNGSSVKEAEYLADEAAKIVDRAYVEDEIAADVAGRMLEKPDAFKEMFRDTSDMNILRRAYETIRDWYNRMIAAAKGDDEKKHLMEVRDRFNEMYNELTRENAANEKIMQDVADKLGSGFEGKGKKYSTTSIIKGSGFDIVENDGRGNVAITIDGKTFDYENPVTADDVARRDSPLTFMMDDARSMGLLSRGQERVIYDKYASLLNLYLYLGQESKGGLGNLQDTFTWLGHTVLRSIKSNGDKQYSYSNDIMSICKKNEAVINAISARQLELNRGLTPSEIIDLYRATDSFGYQVPCPVCYVFSRYIRNGKYASAAINGMLKYGEHLPGGGGVEWTAKDWADELMRLTREQKSDQKYFGDSEEEKALKKKAAAFETALKNANEVVTYYEENIDSRVNKIAKMLTGEKKLSPKEEAKLRKELEVLDKEYVEAVKLISQGSLTNWIKSFAIKQKGEDWVMREDAGVPENWEEFKSHALDLRKTPETIEKYPGIQRLRKSGGSAGGKEITQESNNEVGEVAMGLGLSNDKLHKYPNYYKEAAEATDPAQREALRKKARERFAKAASYVAKQNLRGGQRFWSWSDNLERLSPDIALNLMSMEMLGGGVQTYSKQLEGVELMASMGAYVNGSLMAKDNGVYEVRPDNIEVVNGVKVLKTPFKETVTEIDPNTGKRVERERILAEAGSPIYEHKGKAYVAVFDDIIGIAGTGRNGKLGLFDLNRQYDRAGNIIVGMNDLHVRTVLSDPRIFFCIPWHSSGAHNHILNQMLEILGTDMRGLEKTDYTSMQEEKNFAKKNDKGELPKIPDRLKTLWGEYEKIAEDNGWACGTGKIDHNQDYISDSQRHYRALRDAIFDGTVKEGTREYDEIMGDIFLSQVYDAVQKAGGKMTTDDKGYIYPYEYWDKSSTYGKKGVPDTADINGARYIEYCRRLGFSPKFSGNWKAAKNWNVGNFVNDKGYWKLLIDRRMYDREGNYQEMSPIDSSGFSPDLVNPAKVAERHHVTQVADAEGTAKIVAKAGEMRGDRAPSYTDEDYKIDPVKAAEAFREASAARKKVRKQLIPTKPKAPKRMSLGGGKTRAEEMAEDYMEESEVSPADASGKRYSIQSKGLPYRGSKGRIADRLVDALPEGERFVDLFAGGGAMTQGAMESGKYKGYHLNDKSESAINGILAARDGKYDDMEPSYPTDEEFNAMKGTGEEFVKSHSGFGDYPLRDRGRDDMGQNIRRARRFGEAIRPYTESTTTSVGDYRDVELREGDVVYADLPYSGTRGYKAKFSEKDKQEFSDWALSQDVPIFVSERSMPEGWTEVYSMDVRDAAGNIREEKMFVQDKFARGEPNGRKRYSISTRAGREGERRGIVNPADVRDNKPGVESRVRFSLRTKEPPKNTKKVYKLMRLGEDGKLYPLFIDSTDPIELGKWYDADSPNLDMLKEMPDGVHLVNPETGESTTLEDYCKERGIKVGKYPPKSAVEEATANGMRWVYIEPTERGQKRFGGENRKYWNIGINGSGTVSTFSMRPGWHAGSLPTMRQIGKGAGKNLRDDRFVWVEGEISADVDYNEEAQRNPDKDIPTHIPTDGFYMKATNANAKASQADRVGWYISGAFKPNRLISDREARSIIDEWNNTHPNEKVEYDFPRESGKEFNAETMRLEDVQESPYIKDGKKNYSLGGGDRYSISQGDYSSRLRELFRRRRNGEDVTAELQALNDEWRNDAQNAAADFSARASQEQANRSIRRAEQEAQAAENKAAKEEDRVSIEIPKADLPLTGYETPQTAIDLAQEAQMRAVVRGEGSREQRRSAIRGLTATMSNLHKAMREQREYDKQTVGEVVNFAKTCADLGLLDNATLGEVKKVMTAIKDATGAEDLHDSTTRLLDVVLNAQARNIKNTIKSLLNTPAAKIGAKGVVEGKMDVSGQYAMKELNSFMGSSESKINAERTWLQNQRDKAERDIREGDMREKARAQRDLEKIKAQQIALEIAKNYMDRLTPSEDNIRVLEKELEDLKQDYKDGLVRGKEYREEKHLLENMLREERVDQLHSLWDSVNDIRTVIEEGVEGGKTFAERQQKHAEDVIHDANKDLEGVSTDTQERPGSLAKAANNAIVSGASASLYTLDTMLRALGSRSINGEGFLFNRFGRGWLECRDNEIEGFWANREALDGKARELFGVKKFSDLIGKARGMKKIKVTYKDGANMKEHDFDQAQALYVYMVNKMDDGKMKLRRMGISEEDVENIKNQLDKRFVKLADWLQSDFLAKKHAEYNEVHMRMFGAPLTHIKDYVPLRIDPRRRAREVDISADNENDRMSTTTSGVIERTRNTQPLDLLNTNAIDLVLDHLVEMNHWQHFAEWNRDVNTLLSDTTFRNKIENSKTMYGSGEQLWNRLNQVFQLAGGVYKPKSGDFDKAVVNIAQGVSAAKVSFRAFTAAKQLLSLPVFATECDPHLLLKNVAELFSPKKGEGKVQNSFFWCMQNLPSFKERWRGRMAGDTRLESTELDWSFTKNKIVQWAAKWGLTPNAFIDACTVAAGAKSVYETKYNRYLKQGFSEEMADRRAKQDATIAFNQSQQSSEKMFVAPMQVDRTIGAAGATLFRNASMGYERKLVSGLKDSAKFLADLPSGGKERRAFMERQYREMGLTEAQAKKAAMSTWIRHGIKSLLNIGMYGFVAQACWNIGGKLPYLMFGDNGDEKRKILKEEAWHAALGGWLEGLPFGDNVSNGINNWWNGKPYMTFDPALLPIQSDIMNIMKKFDKDFAGGEKTVPETWSAVTDVINLGVQAGIGVNPETFTNILAGIVDWGWHDKNLMASFDTTKEALLFTLRFVNTPQTQLDQMYIDEIGMTGAEAKKLSPEKLAKRYAFYKTHQSTITAWHLYDKEQQDKIIDKYSGNMLKKMRGGIKENGGSPEDYLDYLENVETKKEHKTAQNSYVEALAKQGPQALREAWEKEKAKGKKADYKLIRALMSKWQQKVYGEEKMPTSAEEAYEAEHEWDISKTAEKVGRDLGFDYQDTFFQLSQKKTKTESKKNKVVKEFKELGGKFVFTKDKKALSLQEGGLDYPVRDKAKMAKCLKFIKEHEEELTDVYITRWCYNRVGTFYDKIDEVLADKELNKEERHSKLKPYYEEIVRALKYGRNHLQKKTAKPKK